MSKLNQIIAVANGKKTKCTASLTEVYKKLQKDDLFNGISRKYHPLDEDGETQPPEGKHIQYRVADALEEASNAITELMDIVLTQDTANCSAKADIVVDNKTIAKDVPVTHLLFLEKQLVDIRTFVSKLPVLDLADEWKLDTNRNAYVTNPSRTNKTKKVMKNHVKAKATDKHPEQVDVFTEDVKVGEWETIKFSGAVPVTEKVEYANKVEKLIEAVKFAREHANNTDVEPKKIGESVLNYIFKN
jgi:hypothetical protein